MMNEPPTNGRLDQGEADRRRQAISRARRRVDARIEHARPVRTDERSGPRRPGLRISSTFGSTRMPARRAASAPPTGGVGHRVGAAPGLGESNHLADVLLPARIATSRSIPNATRREQSTVPEQMRRSRTTVPASSSPLMPDGLKDLGLPVPRSSDSDRPRPGLPALSTR